MKTSKRVTTRFYSGFKREKLEFEKLTAVHAKLLYM